MATINTTSTLGMEAEFYRNLGIIDEDKAMLKKVYDYVQRLAKQMVNDPTRMTQEDYLAMLKKSKAQVAEGKIYRFDDKEKMLGWLNSL